MIIIGQDSISGKSNLNTLDWNTSLKRDEVFVHGRETGVRQAYSSAYSVKLCSVILAICFWILQSINCLFPYTSKAITTFLTLWIINIIVVININSKQWQNKLGVLHTKSEVYVLTVISGAFCCVCGLKCNVDTSTNTNTNAADNCCDGQVSHLASESRL